MVSISYYNLETLCDESIFDNADETEEDDAIVISIDSVRGRKIRKNVQLYSSMRTVW